MRGTRSPSAGGAAVAATFPFRDARFEFKQKTHRDMLILDERWEVRRRRRSQEEQDEMGIDAKRWRRLLMEGEGKRSR